MQVLDAVDLGQSALICAPTSSGKTFISSYCMHSVLSTSKDGCLAFVAPTKATPPCQDALGAQVVTALQAAFGAAFYCVWKLWLFVLCYIHRQPLRASLLYHCLVASARFA